MRMWLIFYHVNWRRKYRNIMGHHTYSLSQRRPPRMWQAATISKRRRKKSLRDREKYMIFKQVNFRCCKEIWKIYVIWLSRWSKSETMNKLTSDIKIKIRHVHADNRQDRINKEHNKKELSKTRRNPKTRHIITWPLVTASESVSQST